MKKMKWVLVGVLFATAMTMAGCGENGPHVQQASNGEVSGGTGEQQTFLSPIPTGYSNTAGLVFDIPQNLADSVKLTVHVPTDTVTSVTFIATPQDGANPATVSPATATVKDGVATTILTGSGVYNVTATANSSMAKTVASGGTTLSASILVSTLTPAWQQALAPQAGYTSIVTSQVANANGVYVVATNTAMNGDSVSQLSIFNNRHFAKND